MRIRVMSENDIPAGMRLKEVAGWNQTRADWERFLKASPQGCFVAEVDGKVCGTAATIPYENRLAWIGMVLVDPEYRSRGIGTQLLHAAIEYLNERGIATIKLDATPQGKLIYEKLGFAAEFEIERWTLRRSAGELDKRADRATFEPVAPDTLEAILKADRMVFGADRRFLLEDLHVQAPQFTMGIAQGVVLQGYAFGRHGSFADHLGPWMAANPDAARRVLEAFLAGSAREVIIVDCLKDNVFASDLLRSWGFTYSRPLTRMFRGFNKYAGQTDNLCAILGPEFG